MKISEVFCAVCGTAFTTSDFEELSCKEFLQRHTTMPCPKCNSEGMKLRIQIPGMDADFRLQKDVESKEIYMKGEELSEDSGDGTSIAVIPTYKESAVAKNLWYVIVQKKEGDSIAANVVRLTEAGNPWIAQLDNPEDDPVVFSVIEKNLNEILEIPSISSIVLKPAVISTQNGKRKVNASTVKKLKTSYVVACSNRLARKPVYLTKDKGNITVSQIYNAELYETEEAAQEDISNAKEEFGSAYNHYDVLPIPTVVARAVIRQKKK